MWLENKSKVRSVDASSDVLGNADEIAAAMADILMGEGIERAALTGQQRGHIISFGCIPPPSQDRVGRPR